MPDPQRALTVHALKLEVRDADGDVLPSLRPFWTLLHEHPERLKPVHRAPPDKAVSGAVRPTADGTGAMGSVSGTAHRNLGEAAEMNTYVREPLPLREDQGIARTLYWRAWNLEQYQGRTRRERGAILLYPSLRGATGYRGFEKLLNNAVVGEGWRVEIGAIRNPDPTTEIDFADGFRSIKLAGSMNTDQQGYANVGSLRLNFGFSHPRAHIKVQPPRGEHFSAEVVDGVYRAVNEERDTWQSLQVERPDGLSLDLFDGLLQYRITVRVNDSLSGALNASDTIQALHEVYRNNRNVFLSCLGVTP